MYFFPEPHGHGSFLPIFFVKNLKRLNILYTYYTDKSEENELFILITNWAISNDIDLVWAVNTNTEFENIFPTIFNRPLKFASWSLDEKILRILNEFNQWDELLLVKHQN